MEGIILTFISISWIFVAFWNWWWSTCRTLL